LVFHLKTRVLQGRRAVLEIRSRPPWHAPGTAWADAPVIAEKRAPLWRELSAAEFPLTAGKVENLRRAARAFHGTEIAAGIPLSFWRQLGRTTRTRGFTEGRELREGCMVPAVGGGLCQLSGLLYQAALDAGLEIVERHAHSRVVPNSAAELNLDATVFWNYVDLRVRGAHDWRLEVELTAAEIVVRIRSPHAPPANSRQPSPREASAAPPSGDCLTCGMLECFRHPAATAAHAPSLGHSAFLLDARWPEFDEWCAGHAREGDHWFTPLDGARWRKPNYQWTPPPGVKSRHATTTTLLRSWRQRSLPAQGAIRQRCLLDGEAALARCYVEMIDPSCRHLVVSQNLLPHLWQSGALGGRSFDVLLERWPVEELQKRLDAAKSAHPESTTLGDFRADPALARAESEALAAAGRLITPHRALAAHFGSRAWRIDWKMPPPLERAANGAVNLFFPASRLGRKGAFELADAIKGIPGLRLIHLGRANEGAADPFTGISCEPCRMADLATATALVIPAWVEHQPRPALLALASGIPVIATEACGLPEHELLHTLSSPDPAALRAAILAVIRSSAATTP
jgi:hypothetical protein